MPRWTFDSWYGVLYDAGVQSPLAPLGAALLWGADGYRMLESMAAAIECDLGQVVLDCPAGGGVTFAGGAPRTRGLLVAADLSRQMLERAARRRAELPAGRRRRVALLQADATRLPLADASVDRIACFNSLHCIPGHAPVLREFRRVLKPGAELVGTVLTEDAPPPWKAAVEVAKVSGFFFPPDSRRLAAQARRAGFRSWETDRTGALLFFRAT